ncbi:MAG: hypothetical protein AAF202_08085 [Pseudomonadota bacterium]
MVYLVSAYVFSKLWLVSLAVYGLITHPVVHTGLPFWEISILITVFSLGSFYFLKVEFARWTLVWLVLLWALIIFYDQCQLLIPYEFWIQMGMPVEKGICW